MTTPEKKTTSTKTSTSTDSGEAEVQSTFDEANEKGYFGTTPDPTPNENYTLQGVVAGKPTPESQAAERRAADAGR